MSIDVLIKQTGFFKKPLPLETITGNVLAYGEYEYDHLNPDSIGNGEIVVYDPSRIGRGFSVTWTPKEKKAISLRLIHPTTKEELRAFCDTVERIANEWKKVRITVDGARTSLSDFLAGFDDMVEFNDKTLSYFCRKVIKGELDNLALHSARWMLLIDCDDAKVFMDSPEAYGDWLHSKQTAADSYETPIMVLLNESEALGLLVLESDCRIILPKTPAVPANFVAKDGKPPLCNVWKTVLPTTKFDPDAQEFDDTSCVYADYSVFLESIPKEKITDYDADHILIDSFTQDELSELIAELEKEEKLTHEMPILRI